MPGGRVILSGHGGRMLSITRPIGKRAMRRNGGIEPRGTRGKVMRNRCNAVCRKQAKRAVMSIISSYITYVVGSRISLIAAVFPIFAQCMDNLSGRAVLWFYVHNGIEIDLLFLGFGLVRLGECAIISTQCKDASSGLRDGHCGGSGNYWRRVNACSNSAVHWGQGSTPSRGGVGLCPFSLFWRLV